ncbi:hypothetical protein SDC9_187249 [bioreactor metagenome]|uniref:Uncharacterized protein n=1 Tax=bioreactor metagenome TaxID=1076179 RepID=A0A645HLR0_9ZZZZ
MQDGLVLAEQKTRVNSVLNAVRLSLPRTHGLVSAVPLIKVGSAESAEKNALKPKKQCAVNAAMSLI